MRWECGRNSTGGELEKMGFFEKYKNVILLFVMMIVLMVTGTAIGFFGMRHFQLKQYEQEAITRAVKKDIDGFCRALEAGDIKKARQYCSEDVAVGMGFDMMDPTEYRRLLLKGLSVKEEDLSEATMKNLDALTASLGKAMVTGTDYNMDELVIGEGDRNSVTAMLPVKIKGCGSLVNIDFSGEIALANVSIANYTTENQKRLMDIYDKEGVEAVREDMQTHELGSLFSAMSSQTKKAAEAEQDWHMTFTIEKDEEGLITSAKISNASKVQEDPEEEGSEKDAEDK